MLEMEQIRNIYSYQHQDSVIEKYLFWTNVIPFLTLPIYLEGAYCLFSCNYKFQQHYVSVLTVHVTLSFIGECYGFFLMRPVVILPIVGLYSDGLLASHLHSFLQVILFFFLFQINACTMIHLLLLRFKTIVPFTYRYYTKVTQLGTLFVFATYFCSVISLGNFALLIEDQDHAKQFWLDALHGSVPDNFGTPNYIVTSGGNMRFDLFLKLCACSLVAYTCSCIIIPTVAFQVLSKVKDRLSVKVIKGHKQYLKSVLIQVAIIISFLLIPFATFIIGLKMRVHSPLLVAVSITLAISHGAASTLAMIFANKPYREILFAHFESGWKVIMCSSKSADQKTNQVSSITPNIIF